MSCFSITTQIGYVCALSCLATPVLAHNVKTSGDVGATFHIEPNHNPRAGEANQAWFALTRQGGESILLEECECKLQIYSQSRAQAILSPPLQPISVEQYQGIPGAEIIFPEAGIYQLEISGAPKSGIDFQPFKLTYNVTVSPGITPPAESSKTTEISSGTEEINTTNKPDFSLRRLFFLLPPSAILLLMGLWLMGKSSKKS